MILSEAVKSATTLREKAQVVWQHYESRKLKTDLEPNWTHAAYATVERYIQGVATIDEQHLVTEIVSSHSLKDGYAVSAFPGMPNSPMRIIHDGWKSGTPTWIFMGRAEHDAVKDIGDGWVVVSRSLPPEYYGMIDKNAAPATLWAAYHRDRQMGTSALTANCVGPAVTFEELTKAVGVEKSHVSSELHA